MRLTLAARRFFTALLATLASAGCAGERGSDFVASTTESVIGGSSDPSDDAVVSIVTSPDASTNPELCTGTIIAPRVVLTAGHCTIGQDASSLIVGVGLSAKSPTSTLNVAAVITYPGFTGSTDDLDDGLDVGAIVLGDDAPIAPIPIARDASAAIAGAPLRLVGFGYSVASDEDTRGTRRQGDVRVDAACSALLAFGDGATNACHGDSGGPLLARAADGGGEVVAGIVSFGDEVACARPTFAARVDRYAAWIDSIVAGAIDGGTCAACPPRTSDCESIEGEADAGGADASGGIDSSADDASAIDGASPGGSNGSDGGCAIVRDARSPRAAPFALFVAIAIALTVRRGRARRSGSPRPAPSPRIAPRRRAFRAIV